MNVFLPLPDTWLGENFPDVHHAGEMFLKDLFGILPRKPEKIMIPILRRAQIVCQWVGKKPTDEMKFALMNVSPATHRDDAGHERKSLVA